MVTTKNTKSYKPGDTVSWDLSSQKATPDKQTTTIQPKKTPKPTKTPSKTNLESKIKTPTKEKKKWFNPFSNYIANHAMAGFALGLGMLTTNPKPNIETTIQEPTTYSYTIGNTHAVLDSLSHIPFKTVKTSSPLIEKLDAYTHNINILVEAEKAIAEDYASIGTVVDKYDILKETLPQGLQESGLQHIWPSGSIVASYQSAKGVKQFTDIGIKDVNQKLKEAKKKNKEYECIEPIDKQLAYEASSQGAIENIRANILYKKLLLEKFGEEHELSDDNLKQFVTGTYHQGEGRMRRALKNYGHNQFTKGMGPKGKNYVKSIEAFKKEYENPDQFKEYAIEFHADKLLRNETKKAKEASSKERKLQIYHNINEFINELEMRNISYDEKYKVASNYELARAYHKFNPEKSREFAMNVVQDTQNPKTKTEKMYHKNALFIVNNTQLR